MAAPTPDQTPDIRLLVSDVATMEAASGPNAHQKIALSTLNDTDVGVKTLIYVDQNGNGYVVPVSNQDAAFKALKTAPVLASSEKLLLLDSTSTHGITLEDSAGVAQLIFKAGNVTLQDGNLTSPIALAASGTTALDTTAQEIIDAINELHTELAAMSLQTVYDVGNEILLADSTPFKVKDPGGRNFNVTYTFGTNKLDLHFGGDDVDITGTETTLTGTTFLKFKDANLTDAVPISQATHVALLTTNQSIVGAINELYAADTAEPAVVLNAATLTVDETHKHILVSYTDTGAVTITIASAEIAKLGRVLTIKDSGGNASNFAITIETEGAEEIDGETDAIIDQDYGSITLISDGSNLSVS